MLKTARVIFHDSDCFHRFLFALGECTGGPTMPQVSGLELLVQPKSRTLDIRVPFEKQLILLPNTYI